MGGIGLGVAVAVGNGEAVSVTGGVFVATGVFVTSGVLVGGPGVEVGATVGVGGSADSRLALSQYMSLCLLAKSGFVRMKTVMVRPNNGRGARIPVTGRIYADLEVGIGRQNGLIRVVFGR